MFGFRRSVLEFQQAQLENNQRKHETIGHVLATMDAMSERLRFLEQRMTVAEPTGPPTTPALVRELRAESQKIHGEMLVKLRKYLECIREQDVALRETLAERDALRAQVGAVKAVLDRSWPDDEDHHDFVNRQVEDARAALREVPRG